MHLNEGSLLVSLVSESTVWVSGDLEIVRRKPTGRIHTLETLQ